MEQKGISLTILGIVAIIAIVGLVLLFTGGATGKAAGSSYDTRVAFGLGAGGGAPKDEPYCTTDPQEIEWLLEQQKQGKVYCYNSMRSGELCCKSIK